MATNEIISVREIPILLEKVRVETAKITIRILSNFR